MDYAIVTSFDTLPGLEQRETWGTRERSAGSRKIATKRRARRKAEPFSFTDDWPLTIGHCYFVLPPSIFSSALAPACAAANLAVSTRYGEHET